MLEILDANCELLLKILIDFTQHTQYKVGVTELCLRAVGGNHKSHSPPINIEGSEVITNEVRISVTIN